MEFGEKLRQAREAKGMTQQSLADKLYVTRQAVSRWECGARYPDLMTAKCLADILKVSMDELLSGDEFREYAEKQPVLESGRAGKIELLLYAAMSVLCGMNLGRTAFSALLSVMSAEPTAGMELYMICKEMLFHGLLFGVSLYGTIQSFRQNTIPAITGYIGMLYFLFTGIHRMTILVVNFDLMHQLPSVLIIVVDFLFAAAVWLCFCQKLRKLEKAVCWIGIIEFLWQLMVACMNLSGLLRSGYVEQSYFTGISYLSELALLGVLALMFVYEVRILRRKRQQGTV